MENLKWPQGQGGLSDNRTLSVVKQGDYWNLEFQVQFGKQALLWHLLCSLFPVWAPLPTFVL